MRETLTGRMHPTPENREAVRMFVLSTTLRTALVLVASNAMGLILAGGLHFGVWLGPRL